jgi:hypothetical protein
MLRPEDVAELSQWLRDHDLRVDPQQAIAAVRLLSASGRPASILELGPWLAPIFCTNATEQNRFQTLYTEWLRHRGSLAGETGRKADVPERKGNASRQPILTIGPLLLLVVLVAFTYLAVKSRSHETSVVVKSRNEFLPDARVQNSSNGQSIPMDPDGRKVLRYRRWDLPITVSVTHPRFVLNETPLRATATLEDAKGVLEILMPEVPPPMPSASVGSRLALLPAPTAMQMADTRGPDRVIVDLKALAIYAALFLTALGWWLFAALRRRGFLERLPDKSDATVRRIAASVTPALPAHASDLRYLSREMRRRRRVASRELDVLGTLSATLRSGGCPQLVFGARTEPDYIILVDRASAEDHQAKLADEVIRAFLRHGISLDRYEFDGDPRRSRHAPLERVVLHKGTQSLEQLLSRHPDSRLIVFSDGSGLIDRYVGLPVEWLPSLLKWPSTVLMTPQPRSHWGVREWLLDQGGLALLALDGDGIHELGAVLRGDRSWPAVNPQALKQVRPAYLRETDLLLDRIKPKPQVLDAVLADLNEHLEADGTDWLTACAVYPEIHWAITLVVGDCITGLHGNSARNIAADRAAAARPRAYAQRLAQISRLPWMRRGFMPDWLRDSLLLRMRPDVEQMVRARLATFMASVSDPTAALSNQHELSVSYEHRRSAWKDMLVGLRTWWEKRPPREIDEDRIFLRFMSGTRPRLAVAATEALTRLFYREGAPLAGPRTWPLGFAFIAIAALAWTRPPVHSIPQFAPGSLALPRPSLLALDDEGRTVAYKYDLGPVRVSPVSSASDRIGEAGPPSCTYVGQSGVGVESLSIEGDRLKLLENVGGKLGFQVTTIPREYGNISCEILVLPGQTNLRSATGYEDSTLISTPLAGAATQLSGETLCRVVDGASVTIIGRGFATKTMLGNRGAAVRCVASGDGQRLAVLTQDGSVFDVPLRRGLEATVERTANLPAGGATTTLALSGDGRMLALVRQDGSVWLQRDRKSEWTTLGMVDARAPLTISANGAIAAFSTSQREIGVWQVQGPGTSEPTDPAPVPATLLGDIKFEVFACGAPDNTSDKLARDAMRSLLALGAATSNVRGPLVVTDEVRKASFAPQNLPLQVRYRADIEPQASAVRAQYS